jgi:putative DNA methylase
VSKARDFQAWNFDLLCRSRAQLSARTFRHVIAPRPCDSNRYIAVIALGLEVACRIARLSPIPSNLHTWWSRKPLGIARAIIFASLVDDPSEYLSDQKAEEKRAELFSIIARLSDVTNGDNKDLLDQAKREILQSNDGQMPSFWDPFCGGGALPLEALRLGLPTIASDLNPVAVFITRVLIELAPPQARHAPINPTIRKTFLRSGENFEGLKADVEHYAEIVEPMASTRCGSHAAPPAKRRPSSAMPASLA